MSLELGRALIQRRLAGGTLVHALLVVLVVFTRKGTFSAFLADDAELRKSPSSVSDRFTGEIREGSRGLDWRPGEGRLTCSGDKTACHSESDLVLDAVVSAMVFEVVEVELFVERVEVVEKKARPASSRVGAVYRGLIIPLGREAGAILLIDEMRTRYMKRCNQ